MCKLVNDKLEKKGLRYFARHSYDIASSIKSPIKRFIADLIVFKVFKYRYIPPSIYTIYSHTPFMLSFIVYT